VNAADLIFNKPSWVRGLEAVADAEEGAGTGAQAGAGAEAGAGEGQGQGQGQMQGQGQGQRQGQDLRGQGSSSWVVREGGADGSGGRRGPDGR